MIIIATLCTALHTREKCFLSTNFGFAAKNRGRWWSTHCVTWKMIVNRIHAYFKIHRLSIWPWWRCSMLSSKTGEHKDVIIALTIFRCLINTETLTALMLLAEKTHFRMAGKLLMSYQMLWIRIFVVHHRASDEFIVCEFVPQREAILVSHFWFRLNFGWRRSATR